MSEVLVTPSVFAIAALPVGLLVGGAMLTAFLVRRLANTMEDRSRTAFENAVKTLPQMSADVLRPPSLVAHDSRLHMKAALSQMEGLHLSPAEQIRVSALLSLASAPYVVDSQATLEQPMAALLSAKTLDETQEARDALLKAARTGHEQVFTRGLTHAYTNAARKIGFSTVQVSTGPFGEVRLVASDSNGRSLVGEIQRGKHGDPSLAAEVVGVRDGSCHEILDAFEGALAEQGVRYSAPRRRSTGGVCQLKAARYFFSRWIDRTADSGLVPASDGQDSQRRAQRLNQRKVQQTR